MKFFVHFKVLSLLLLTYFFSGLAACQEQKRQPNRYLIPDGYVGWVRIDFKVRDAPALPDEEGFHVVKFPPSGHVQTSSNPEFGWAQDEYYYYTGANRKRLRLSGWGEGGMIWGGFNGSLEGSDEPPYEYFFVGSEQQFKEIGLTYKEEDGRPKVGPIS